jgi:hypothetical protein
MVSGTAKRQVTLPTIGADRFAPKKPAASVVTRPFTTAPPSHVMATVVVAIGRPSPPRTPPCRSAAARSGACEVHDAASMAYKPNRSRDGVLNFRESERMKFPGTTQPPRQLKLPPSKGAGVRQRRVKVWILVCGLMPTACRHAPMESRTLNACETDWLARSSPAAVAPLLVAATR